MEVRAVPRVVAVLVVQTKGRRWQPVYARLSEIAFRIINRKSHDTFEGSLKQLDGVRVQGVGILAHTLCISGHRRHRLWNCRADGEAVYNPVLECIPSRLSPVVAWIRRHRRVRRFRRAEDPNGIRLHTLIGSEVDSPLAHVIYVFRREEEADIRHPGGICDGLLRCRHVFSLYSVLRSPTSPQCCERCLQLPRELQSQLLRFSYNSKATKGL